MTYNFIVFNFGFFFDNGIFFALEDDDTFVFERLKCKFEVLSLSKDDPDVDKCALFTANLLDSPFHN